MTFHISLVERGDLSGEIYRQIREAIVAGRLRPGERLSPTREMASALAVSRSTVVIAYERLTSEGLIISQVGAGTFVGPVLEAKPSNGASGAVPASAITPRPLWQSVPLPTAFARPARFDFRTGLPDAALFPHRAWRRVVARSWREPEVLGGVYESAAGLRRLREAIVRHIVVSRGVAASADDLMITNGTQQALDILARLMLEPGDIIAMEDPGYQPPKHLFRSLGARVVGVPVDDEGLNVEALPRAARVVYVTPSHQYPLGVAMSLQRRRALLAFARQTGALIIEDDYDSEFRFGGRPLETLQSLDSSGSVVYVGSFSKTLLPTIRLGFMILPRALSEAAHKAKFVSDWHTSVIGQNALAAFIEEGSFARHLRKVGAHYRERHRLVTQIIGRTFGDDLALIPSTTGLHVAAEAPRLSPKQIERIADHAADQGVAVQRLSRLAVEASPRAGIMLGYGAIRTQDIAKGLRLLKASFDSVAGSA